MPTPVDDFANWARQCVLGMIFGALLAIDAQSFHIAPMRGWMPRTHWPRMSHSLARMPPLTAVSDAFPLLGKLDGVIIVGRVGPNRRDVAQRLHETLTGAGAPLLGVVANGFKSGRLGGYGYGCSYDYATGVKGASDDGGPPAGEASPNGAGVSAAPVPSSQG